MLKFNKCKLNDKLLDQWIHADVNVLLIGEKGVGKSAQILNAFDRNKLKYAYFSGATLDPWIHLLGIPKAKVQQDGKEKMEFILPENLDNDVQAIFCDEWNRTNKVVRNALLELQQFKSINGRKFPNLKIVWGAVNPPKDDSDDSSADYDVDELDPAQLDRFHIIVELPNEPDLTFFKKRFGEYYGKILVDWWKEQSVESKKILSPRRLEYIGDSFNKGLDVKFLLPASANAGVLIKKLSSDESEELIRKLLESPNDEEMIEFVKNDDKFLKYRGKLKESKYWKYWEHANPEFVVNEIKTNENFANFAMYKICKNSNFYKEQLVEISKSDPSNELLRIIKVLKAQKYTPPDECNISQLVGDGIKFPVIPILQASQPDTFSTDYRFAPFVPITSTKFSPESLGSGSNINTAVRNILLDLLQTNIYSVPINRSSSFILGCLSSMQAGTIQKNKAFIPLLGTMCILVKKHFDENTLKRIADIILNNRSKISSNRIEDFTEYLLGKPTNLFMGVPEEFLQKIKDIKSMMKAFSESKL
jgi:hypothetical protein